VFLEKILIQRIKTLAGLVLLAGVVLITGVVWAKATKDDVDCEFDYGGTYTAKQWIDDDNVLHLRGITYGLTSTSGNIEIDIGGVCNHNYDLNTGDGDFWGDDHKVEVTWGDLTGTFRGRYGGITVEHAGISNHSYQGISGDFVGWKLRFDATWDFIGKTGAFTGILYNPHGE